MLQDQQIAQEWAKCQNELGELYYLMIQQGSITLKDKTLHFQYHHIGAKPPGGYSLVFGLHGGGGCPPHVNQQQYINHLALYDSCLPQGVIWIALRSCQQASDMWWKPYLPEFFSIIIRGFVLKGMVDPNKVFLTGYSAGGDGVYHMGPILADWFAAAAMMAGHPNNTQLYNMRNCPFSIQVGGRDAAYNRNNLAKQYIQKMDLLHQKYGRFSTKYCKVWEECEHWMNLKDGHIFCNFVNEVRNPYPNLVLFKQHERYPRRYFYYLGVESEKNKELLIVLKRGNQFHIESELMPVSIYINRLFVDFTQQVRVFHNKVLTVERMPERDFSIVSQTITDRVDPAYIFEDCLISYPACQRVPLEMDSALINEPERPFLPHQHELPERQIQEAQRRQQSQRGCCEVM